MNSQRERLLEMLDEGYPHPEATIRWLVSWLSEDDVGAIIAAKELSERFDEDYDDE